jgi:membrane protein insertase Oxa1/YidC/SpoIIIJ
MPSGLILYWAVSNLLTIAQNALIRPDPAKLAAKPKKKPLFRKPSYNEMLKRMGKR